MKTFIIFLITGILCTHCTQKYIKMDKDNLHTTGNTQSGLTEKASGTPARTANTPPGIADLNEKELVEAFFQTMEYEDIERCKKVLQEAEKRGIAKKVVNSVHNNKLGNTALMGVSGAGRVEWMNLLLAAGAEVNTVGGELASKWTALHYAAFKGRTDAVELLLKSGADKDAPGKDKQTPLHYAASQGHTGVVELLVEKGAKIEATSEDDSTPLLLAVGGGHPDVVAFLLKKELIER